MLLNVSIKDNSAQRASVIFKQSGEVVTNLWGQNTWWQVTDPATIAACNDTRRSSGGTAASPLWSDLLTKDPAVLAKPVQPVGFRPSGRPRFGAGQLDSTAASPAQVLAEETTPQINKEDLVDRWFRFFSEFKFKPLDRLPKLSKKSITVKKGKTAKVKILYKKKGSKNTYKKTKYAKVVSKRTASTIKVKGLKKGKTTLKIKVNGTWLKLKVRVK